MRLSRFNLGMFYVCCHYHCSELQLPVDAHLVHSLGKPSETICIALHPPLVVPQHVSLPKLYVSLTGPDPAVETDNDCRRRHGPILVSQSFLCGRAGSPAPFPLPCNTNRCLRAPAIVRSIKSIVRPRPFPQMCTQRDQTHAW